MIDPYIDSFDEELLGSTSPTRSLHGYWIVCVTPKTRFPGDRPTKSRRLDLAEPGNATNAVCLISGLHFRASPWLSEAGQDLGIPASENLHNRRHTAYKEDAANCGDLTCFPRSQ